MLRIRFFRTGRKRQPFYKIVVTDKNNPPASGRFVEDVGYYNPVTKECSIKGERVLDWMKKGAQPSDVVHNLLVKRGIIVDKKILVGGTMKKEEKGEEPTKEDSVSKEELSEEKEEKVEEPTKEEEKEPSKEEETKEKPPAKDEGKKEVEDKTSDKDKKDGEVKEDDVEEKKSSEKDGESAK